MHMNIGLYVLSLVSAFVITTCVLRIIIPKFKAKKIGQMILEEGPSWHKSKEGTPTMGGISFVFASVGIMFLFFLLNISVFDRKESILFFNVIIFCLLNALIGAIDDIAKLRKERNKGLSAKAKITLQMIIAFLFLLSLHYFVGIDTKIYFSFLESPIDLGILFYIFSFFIICGIINSVNLSDGVDGLAASQSLCVGIFLSIISFTVVKNTCLIAISSVLVGGCLGFLIFNRHPAKVFMGDTGSLFLGALIVSTTFYLNNIFLVILYGFIFVCEAISVILQVSYFKLTKGKRLFLMTPLHHHFEKKGWSENKIVLIFSLVTAISCVASALLVK